MHPGNQYGNCIDLLVFLFAFNWCFLLSFMDYNHVWQCGISHFGLYKESGIKLSEVLKVNEWVADFLSMRCSGTHHRKKQLSEWMSECGLYIEWEKKRTLKIEKKYHQHMSFLFDTELQFEHNSVSTEIYLLQGRKAVVDIFRRVFFFCQALAWWLMITSGILTVQKCSEKGHCHIWMESIKHGLIYKTIFVPYTLYEMVLICTVEQLWFLNTAVVGKKKTKNFPLENHKR